MDDRDTLCEVILAASRQTTRGVTFIHAAGAEFLPYPELHRRASVVAKNLRDRGIAPGAYVLFQLKDEKTFMLAFWGCVLAGCIPVPLATGGQDFHKEKLIAVWELLNGPFLLYDEHSLDEALAYCSSHRHAGLCASLTARAIAAQDILSGNESYIPVTPRTTDIAYIQFSSGSTGSPKGVELTHGNLVANIRDIANRSDMTMEDRMLSWMPLTHDMGLICFHLTGVAKGVDQYIIPTPLFVKRPLLWMEKASEYKATLLYSPNFGYHYVLNAMGDHTYAWDLQHVRLIYNGAEPISHTLIDGFMKRMKHYGLRQGVMYPGYGMAEACVAVTLAYQYAPYAVIWADRGHLQRGEAIRECEPNDERAVAFVSVGSPIDHCRVRICSDDDQILPEDYLGQIQISGANVTRGYIHNEEATVAAFTPDGWLRTGDLGFMRNNVLVVTGRAKNLIIINGQNYYPQDIEHAVCETPGFALGSVVACGSRRGQEAGEALVLFVVYRKALEHFVPLIREIVSNVLRRTGLLVHHVIPVKNVPKTSSGKVQNYKLLREYEDGAFDDVIGAIARLQGGAAGKECSQDK